LKDFPTVILLKTAMSAKHQSSGDPFIFARDKYTHALFWASTAYRYGWYGIDLNTSYQARFMEFL
jgi:phenylacetate-CoA ligase